MRRTARMLTVELRFDIEELAAGVPDGGDLLGKRVCPRAEEGTLDQRLRKEVEVFSDLRENDVNVAVRAPSLLNGSAHPRLHRSIELQSDRQLTQQVADDVEVVVDIFKHCSLGVPIAGAIGCLLYTSPSPRDVEESRMPSSA